MFRASRVSLLVFQLSEGARRTREKSFQKVLDFDKTHVIGLDEKNLDSDIVPKSLWNTATLLRERKSVRSQMKACVVGGSSTIRRIWHDYGVRPNVVFVPDNMEPPSWCFHEQKPSLVVTAPPVMINRDLIHTKGGSDSFAAEFPLPHLPPLENLADPTTNANEGIKRTDRVLVLDGIRNTFNLGGLLKSAKAMGFNTVVSQGVSCDFFTEHAIRTSGGCGFDGSMQLYTSEESNLPLLQLCCSTHKLLPIVGVPSKEAVPLFYFAEKFHAHNLEVELNNEAREARVSSSTEQKSSKLAPLGSMVIISGDPDSSLAMMQQWGDFPLQAVQIQLDGAVDSLNVMTAGNILLHHFRKGAQTSFKSNFERGIRPSEKQEEEEKGAEGTLNADGEIESPTPTLEELADQLVRGIRGEEESN